MKKRIIFILINLMVVFFMGGCLEKDVAIAPKGVLTGIVVDTEGKPLKDVTITAGDKKAVTGENGNFKITDIDVGGNPKYYILLSKKNYIPAFAESNFSSTLTIEDSGKVDGLPLDNSAASIKVTMTELVTIKGSLKLPDGAVPISESIKVEPQITISDDLKQLVPKSGYKNDVSNTLNFQVKDVPKVGIANNSTLISMIKFKLYTGDKTTADYFCEITDSETLNLAAKQKTADVTQNIVEIGEQKLKRYYKVSGYVYGDSTKTTIVKWAKVSLYKGTTVVKEAVSDETGKYCFDECVEGSDYSVELTGFDSNGDGIYDYFNDNKFETFAVGGTNSLITRNVWYQGNCLYSISGKVYAGSKESGRELSGVKVNLYNNGKLVNVAVSDSNGEYKFESVQSATVYCAAESKDANSNGVADFIGYSATDSSTVKAKADILNNSNSNITGKDLILQINKSEPEFKLEVKGCNFGKINYDGSYSEVANEVEPDGKLEVTFSNGLSQDSITAIESKGKKSFTLYDLTESRYITCSYTLSSDKLKITVTPSEYLTSNKYYLELNSELSTEAGNMYKSGNTIGKMNFDTNAESYKLEVSYANFASKNSNGVFVAATNLLVSDDLVIKFNNPVSAEAMKAIIDSGEKVVYLNDGVNEVAVKLDLSMDKKSIIINPDSNLRNDIEYRITVNNKLCAENSYKFGCFRMIDSSTVFSVKGLIAK